MGGYYTGTSSVYGTQIKSIWTDVSERHSRLEFTTCDTTVSTALTLAHDNTATFTGNISTPGITSTLTNSILISYAGSDANGNDAGLKIMNDGSDWGIYIRKTLAADYGLRIDGGGVNALWISNTVGGSPTFKVSDDGDITTARNATFTGGVEATGLDINGTVDFDQNLNAGAFVDHKNSSNGTSAYTSIRIQSDTGNAEIWRNSSTRTQTGGAAQSFNIYNSQDTNI